MLNHGKTVHKATRNPNVTKQLETLTIVLRSIAPFGSSILEA